MPLMYPRLSQHADQPPSFGQAAGSTPPAVAAIVAAFVAATALATFPAQAQAQAQAPSQPQPAIPAQAPQAAPTADEPAYVAAGEAASRSWLAKLDAGDYGATWDAAAAAFRKAITRNKWEADVGSVRKALGPLQERSSRGVRFTRSLPGAPDGDYVLLQNDARFQNKAAAIESITMSREADGVWRVVGYFIR